MSSESVAESAAEYAGLCAATAERLDELVELPPGPELVAALSGMRHEPLDAAGAVRLSGLGTGARRGFRRSRWSRCTGRCKPPTPPAVTA